VDEIAYAVLLQATRLHHALALPLQSMRASAIAIASFLSLLLMRAPSVIRATLTTLSPASVICEAGPEEGVRRVLGH